MGSMMADVGMSVPLPISDAGIQRGFLSPALTSRALLLGGLSICKPDPGQAIKEIVKPKTGSG